MKTTMRVTKNTLSIFVVIVATMNVALAETETRNPSQTFLPGCSSIISATTGHLRSEVGFGFMIGRQRDLFL